METNITVTGLAARIGVIALLSMSAGGASADTTTSGVTVGTPIGHGPSHVLLPASRITSGDNQRLGTVSPTTFAAPALIHTSNQSSTTGTPSGKTSSNSATGTPTTASSQPVPQNFMQRFVPMNGAGSSVSNGAQQGQVYQQQNQVQQQGQVYQRQGTSAAVANEELSPAVQGIHHFGSSNLGNLGSSGQGQGQGQGQGGYSGPGQPPRIAGMDHTAAINTDAILKKSAAHLAKSRQALEESAERVRRRQEQHLAAATHHQ